MLPLGLPVPHTEAHTELLGVLVRVVDVRFPLVVNRGGFIDQLVAVVYFVPKLLEHRNRHRPHRFQDFRLLAHHLVEPGNVGLAKRIFQLDPLVERDLGRVEVDLAVPEVVAQPTGDNLHQFTEILELLVGLLLEDMQHIIVALPPHHILLESLELLGYDAAHIHLNGIDMISDLSL